MTTTYYAITERDESGPAYGIGKTPAEAMADAEIWTDGETDNLIAVEISRTCYNQIKNGNPDAPR
jgi:hypothetical protein